MLKKNNKSYSNKREKEENLMFTVIRKYRKQPIINANKQGVNKNRGEIMFKS